MSSDLSFKKIIFGILYAITFITSVYATGTSLSNSFPEIVSTLAYTFGVIFTVMASSGLVIYIKARNPESILSNSKRRNYLKLGPVILLLGILSSTATNTHQFYLWSHFNDVKKNDLNSIKSHLELLPIKGAEIYDIAYNNSASSGNQLIRNIKDEIIDPNNSGFSNKARTALNGFESKLFLLGDKIQLPALPKSKSMSRWIQFSETLGKRCEDALQIHLQRLSTEKSDFLLKINNTEYSQLIGEVTSTIDDYENSNQKEVLKLIEKGTAKYNTSFELLTQLGQQKYLKDIFNQTDFKPLPKISSSNKIKSILYSWVSLFDGSLIFKSTFIFSLVLAFIGIDLSGIVFLYFGFLNDDQE